MELISRDEAIKQIEEAFNMGDCNCDRFALRGILKSLPTVEERKEGHWIKDGHHIRCSECSEYICDKDIEGDAIPQNFCPNCGAEMKGE